LARAVSMMLNSVALAAAPRGLPENSQFFLPRTKGRIARSQALVSGVIAGWSR
jgi:hypothetical protein